MKDMDILKYWQEKEGQEKIRVMVANERKLPQVTVWCLNCTKMWMSDIKVIEVIDEKEVNVDQVKKIKKKKIKKTQKAKKEEQQVGANQEITPPSSPGKRMKPIKSPGTKVKEMARLLKYHQHLSDEYGMPSSHLQQRLRLEVMSPSSPSTYCFGEGAGQQQEKEEGLGCEKDLRGEFERMGAEALLPPLSNLSVKVREASKEKKLEAEREEGEVERVKGETPTSTVQMLACRIQSNTMQRQSECVVGVGRKEGEEREAEPEDQRTRGLEENTVSTPTFTAQTPACRIQTKPMQRLSECVESEGAVKTTTNWEWWYQPYGWRPNYWASLVFYCSGCQC